MSNYYVYQHHDSKTGEIVYIGIGCKNRAWHSNTNTRSKAHADWLNERFESGENPVVFVKTGLTKSEACAEERPLIAKHEPKFNKLHTKAHGHKLSSITKEQALKCRELREEGLSYKAITEIVWPGAKGAMQAWRSVNHFDPELLV